MFRFITKIKIESKIYKLDNSNLLTEKQIHHIKNVLRMKEGDLFYIFNEINGEWLVQILEISKKNFIIEVIELIRFINDDERKHNSKILIFSLIKPDNMHFIFEKGSELGVSDFFPVITEYSQFKNLNYDKFNLVIDNAVEQSNRLSRPKIHELMKLNNLLDNWGNNIVLKDKKLSILLEREKLKNSPLAKKNKIILVGPEGGFSQNEVLSFQEYNFIEFISLGPNILRAETAVLAGLSNVC